MRKESIPAILVERDYKGTYERFALTPEEFMEDYRDILDGKDMNDLDDSENGTVSPLVHIWYQQCIVGDRMWSKFFTDMTWGLPTIDTECGNIACVREDLMKSLLEYLLKQSQNEKSEKENSPTKHKIRISETLSRVIEVEARTETEAIDIAIRRYRDCEIILDSSDMYEVNFENMEENEK